ncbi:MAG: hypothetical protein WA113_11205 [Desulfitobacteriaceae bacterium]
MVYVLIAVVSIAIVLFIIYNLRISKPTNSTEKQETVEKMVETKINYEEAIKKSVVEHNEKEVPEIQERQGIRSDQEYRNALWNLSKASTEKKEKPIKNTADDEYRDALRTINKGKGE